MKAKVDHIQCPPLVQGMQLIISSQKAIGLVTDDLHLVNLC